MEKATFYFCTKVALGTQKKTMLAFNFQIKVGLFPFFKYGFFKWNVVVLLCDGFAFRVIDANLYVWTKLLEEALWSSWELGNFLKGNVTLKGSFLYFLYQMEMI